MSKRSLAIVIVLTLLGIADAAYLYMSYLTHRGLACSILEGCNVVAASPYSLLFGIIPLSLLGLIFYGAMFALALALWFRPVRAVSAALLLSSIGGFLSSLYFMYVQLVLIRAICIYCVTSAAIASALLLLVLVMWRRQKEPITP